MYLRSHTPTHTHILIEDHRHVKLWFMMSLPRLRESTSPNSVTVAMLTQFAKRCVCFLWIHVYMYACMFSLLSRGKQQVCNLFMVCMCTCVHVYMYACNNVDANAKNCKYECMCIYVLVHICACISVYYISMHNFICIWCACVCAYKWCTHTNIHIYMQASYTSCISGRCISSLTYFHDAHPVGVTWDSDKNKFIVNKTRPGPVWTESK